MLVNTKAKIGVFSIALGAYLPQFPQLVPNFEAQYEDFKKTIPNTVEIIDGGMVTTKEQAMAAGDKFRAADVDLVFLQLLTYATSYNVLPAIRDLDVPVVCINVQKKLAPDYANTDIPIWLGDLYACGAVGEAVADLERAGKRHAVITGVVEGGTGPQTFPPDQYRPDRTSLSRYDGSLYRRDQPVQPHGSVYQTVRLGRHVGYRG